MKLIIIRWQRAGKPLDAYRNSWHPRPTYGKWDGQFTTDDHSIFPNEALDWFIKTYSDKPPIGKVKVKKILIRTLPEWDRAPRWGVTLPHDGGNFNIEHDGRFWTFTVKPTGEWNIQLAQVLRPTPRWRQF